MSGLSQHARAFEWPLSGNKLERPLRAVMKSFSYCDLFTMADSAPSMAEDHFASTFAGFAHMPHRLVLGRPNAQARVRSPGCVERTSHAEGQTVIEDRPLTQARLFAACASW